MNASLRPGCAQALRAVSHAELVAAPTELAAVPAELAAVPAELAAVPAGASGGEGPELRAARVHVAACPTCAGVLDDAAAAGTAGAADAVLARLATHRPPRRPALRIGLAVVALVQGALALPWLFGVNLIGPLDDHVASEHLTRDGAIGLIIGIAGLTTALAPRHSLAMLVMAVAAVGMQVVSFAIDENHDRVHPMFELSHAPLAVIVGLIVVCTLRRPAPVAPPERGAKLRALR